MSLDDVAVDPFEAESQLFHQPQHAPVIHQDLAEEASCSGSSRIGDDLPREHLAEPKSLQIRSHNDGEFGAASSRLLDHSDDA